MSIGRKRYHEIKDEWFGKPEVFDRQDVIEVIWASLCHPVRFTGLLSQERHRIDVDCRRTDRSQPLFANQTSSETSLDLEKQQHQYYSTIAPTPIEVGAQSPSNEHIDRLGSILLTYNFYEKDLGPPFFVSILEERVSADGVGCEGYVQGMSDLCAPLYVVTGSDEPLTFWCFVEVMNRMVRVGAQYPPAQDRTRMCFTETKFPP
jgi:hypothetical protein